MTAAIDGLDRRADRGRLGRASSRLLPTAERPVLLAHVSPDGDALGSALAVGLALRDLGRAPGRLASATTRSTCRGSSTSCPGLDLLVPPATVVGRARAASSRSTRAASTGSACSRPKVAAAGTRRRARPPHLLHRLRRHPPRRHHRAGHRRARPRARRAGSARALTADVATALYAGLLTDTGSFRYAATTPATHELAAELLAAGVPHDERRAPDLRHHAVRLPAGARRRARPRTART